MQDVCEAVNVISLLLESDRSSKSLAGRSVIAPPALVARPSEKKVGASLIPG